ncbi:helix-turn-helix transcriptional regulator [Rhizobium sp. WYJ-E13]|uniref:helix-turn-helix transcriptional regulator n=1 Tax=Rhizobium sp. WYJ-E13 TaxID=2849093 RepID=UPI0020A7642A|nr:helix-turn-helix transcriptional regulator [Rhizobium sp. WYJ-E13]
MIESQVMTAGNALPVGFSATMSKVISKIGRPDFYENVVELLRQMIPCDFWIVARYEDRSRPLIVLENGMGSSAKAAYTDTLWQLDPLPRRWTERALKAVSLNDLRDNGDFDQTYRRYLDKTLRIADELALLFPINDCSFLALCLDRQSSIFSREEIALAHELQQMLIEMHHLHMLRAIDRHLALLLHRTDLGKSEIMILSDNNTVLYKSETWSHAAIQAFEREPEPSEIGNSRVTETMGRDGWSLLRLSRASHDAILAGADIYVLRRTASDLSERVEQFSRLHCLTGRQKQIVLFCLQGYHNASIAERLDITVGSVKNHKLRLYEKLDVTSERELVSAILAHF